MLLKLLEFNFILFTIYCPSKIHLTNIIKLTEHLKYFCTIKLHLTEEDFNINLLDDTSKISSDFLHNLHSSRLISDIILPTRATESATLTDNVFCDFTFLLANTIK